MTEFFSPYVSFAQSWGNKTQIQQIFTPGQHTTVRTHSMTNPKILKTIIRFSFSENETFTSFHSLSLKDLFKYELENVSV